MKNKFDYTYSAPTEAERMEVQSMRSEYSLVPKERTALEKMRLLDKKVRLPAFVFAYVFGIVGLLVFGTGMCFGMKVIGNSLALGIVFGIVGLGMCIANYYIYNAFLSARKKKYSAEILKLSEIVLHDKAE